MGMLWAKGESVRLVWGGAGRAYGGEGWRKLWRGCGEVCRKGVGWRK